jgi:tripartite-type tricarboxylate transporter receptor subunit TctC
MQHTNRRRAAVALAAACACALSSLAARAQPAPTAAFPSKPVRIIVGFAPGGGVDLIARMLANELSKLWGQPVLVDNRAGASGMIGADMVAKAPPDGYLVQLATPNSDTLGPHLMKSPYDALRDFTPITLAVQSPNVLVVNPAVPATTMQELVALAKAKPGTLSFASSGVGSVQQMAGEAFNVLTGAQAVHIAYKGSAAAMVDVVAGQVPMSFETTGGALPFVRGGKLRALAVLAPQRSSALPEVPTTAEAGFPGFEFSTWYGVAGPAGMPQAVTDKWQRSIAQVMQLPAVRDQVRQMGGEVVASTPADFKAFRAREYQRMGALVKQTGVKAE